MPDCRHPVSARSHRCIAGPNAAVGSGRRSPSCFTSADGSRLFGPPDAPIGSARDNGTSRAPDICGSPWTTCRWHGIL